MILKREQLMSIGDTITKLKQQTTKIPLTLRYKILKLELLLQEELTISYSLLSELYNRYAEKNENGEIITAPDGAVKIKTDKINEVTQEFNDFYNQQITIPDYYFTLDELEPFELDWTSMSAFMPLISD